MKKRHAERAHAKSRAFERYDISLNQNRRKNLVRMIKDGKTLWSERQTVRVSVHVLEFEDQLVRVCYDKKRSEVITFLPLIPDKPSRASAAYLEFCQTL